MDKIYRAEATAMDFFKMSMKKTYKSPLGICNVVFFAAAVLLTVKMFGSASPFLRVLLLILCLAFPVFQPMIVYAKASAVAHMIPEGLTLRTTERGLMVSVGEKSETVPYKNIQRIVTGKECVVLYVGAQNGYFLFNRAFEGADEKEEFVAFIKSKMV